MPEISHTILRGVASSGATREVVIGADQPFCLIGERLNPTGRKIFAEQLRRGDLSRIALDVEQQVAGGATMLDVNMGVPLADEAELLAQAITMVQGLTDLPLHTDCGMGFHPIACQMVLVGVQLERGDVRGGQMHMTAGSHRATEASRQNRV